MNIYLIAGEPSGDQLGAALMQALRELSPNIQLDGVGGAAMGEQGLNSLFPMQDIAVMGVSAVLARLPSLISRINQTANDIISKQPDAVVLIDSPDFTHRVAKKVHKCSPNIKIINYVSPTVWAWRPGRAKKMTRYVDHLMAILPFEVEVHKTLGGPATTYVGHPLVDQESIKQLSDADLERRNANPPLILVLPGSRRLEIDRLMPLFGQTLKQLQNDIGDFELALPAVDYLKEQIESHLENWEIKPKLLFGKDAKYAAMRQARAALAASGTVTLELALAQVPMVVSYKVSPIEALLRYLIKVPSIVLPNLILGYNAFPEHLQENATVHNLANSLTQICLEGDVRTKQLQDCKKVRDLMRIGNLSAQQSAAKCVLEIVKNVQ